MSVFEAIFYGFIQGIAEFLPISSSGHLALIENFTGRSAEGDLAFNVLLHLGTLLSVCIAFRKDVFRLIAGFAGLAAKLVRGRIFKEGLNGEERLFAMLFIAALPLIPVKLLGLDAAVGALSSRSAVIGALLIVNGLSLIVCDRVKKGNASVFDRGVTRPLGVGAVQAAFGILPGISRSGSTVTAGRILGYSREEAVRFSFLLSVPTVAGACVSELPKLLRSGGEQGGVAPVCCFAGALTAAAAGLCAIGVLRYFTRKNSFTAFAVYCLAAGAAAITADLLL